MDNNFFPHPLSAEDLQRRRHRARPEGLTLSPPADAAPAQHFAVDPMSAMSDTLMLEGDSLDDIIRDNSNEILRRRSLPQPFGGQADGDRRLSMMDYTAAPEPYKDFQFDGLPSVGDDVMSAGFSMSASMAMPGATSDYAQSGMQNLPDANGFSTISPSMMSNMMAFNDMTVGPMSTDPALGMFAPSSLETQGFPAGELDPGSADFSVDIKADNVPLSATTTTASTSLELVDRDEDMMTVTQGFRPADVSVAPQQGGPNMGLSPFPNNTAGPLESTDTPSSFHSPLSAAHPLAPMIARSPAVPVTSLGMAAPSPATGPPKDSKAGKNIYSRSGFDMIRALYYVASRPRPEVHLGPVDMSCAFVICDVKANDCPIVYVSDNFQNLTGYSRYEIMGRNCRFLQSPDGKVEAGSHREFVENNAVLNLKRKIAEGKEVQQSLINYRKGGRPFLNLLTMVPIPWDDCEVRYFVGFQIDLVECPDAIAGQTMGGVQINYTHSDIPQYVWKPPNTDSYGPEDGQTLGIDDVSALLQQYRPKGVVSDWHKQSWDKMLLENADDVVHVLSLKGNFLYLSPSCKKVLEYDNADLLGSPLSEICHPSDIVPVMRELKDTQVDRPVNVVFRIRRKRSGFTWFESHGSLFAEPGKGRKWLILVGRKRPVFALPRRDLEAHGGIGDAELWTKLSTAGLFLFVSSNVRSLLDLQPENLEGTSIQDLMRKESRAEFGRAVERARVGKIVACKHEVQNRRGQVLQAQTVLYPGDAGEDQKPSFLLAQTRLLKASSRALAPASASQGTGTGTGKTGASPAGVDISSSTPTNPFSPGGQTPSAGRPAEGPGPGGNASMTAGAEGSGGTGSQEGTSTADDDNIFDELKTTRCTSWQYELRQMEKMNRVLAEELGQLLSSKKKRKRRKGVGNVVRDCANCHTRNTPEWRRGPSGQRDLCNSCGLRWAKQMGRVSPRNSLRGGNDAQSKTSNSPTPLSPLQREESGEGVEPGSDAEAGDASLPPPSRPLLAGGSGHSGGGMEMPSIREEEAGGG